jgi:DNA-binding MarR family transcriptional regulator
MKPVSAPPTRSELEDRLERSFKSLRMRVEPRHDTLFRAGLGPSGYLLMQYLNVHGPKRISDAAKVLGVPSASVTGITNNLVRDGFIERHDDEQDRRVVRLQITALGRRKLRDAEGAARLRLEELLRGFTDQDLRQLVVLLERMAANVSARDEQGRSAE